MRVPRLLTPPSNPTIRWVTPSYSPVTSQPPATVDWGLQFELGHMHHALICATWIKYRRDGNPLRLPMKIFQVYQSSKRVEHLASNQQDPFTGWGRCAPMFLQPFQKDWE